MLDPLPEDKECNIVALSSKKSVKVETKGDFFVTFVLWLEVLLSKSNFGSEIDENDDDKRWE